jgi:hypothetical protein
MAQGRGGDLLAAMDANGDGAVTRAEAQAARETMFTRLDGDGDGYLSQAEREAMAHGQGAGRRMPRGNADANGDGRVSRSEFMGQPFRGFDMADANNDGVVTGDEMTALRGRRGGG